jgi:hypothetical protein
VNVKEKGVLKVTANSDDVGITPGWTYDNSVNNYSEIYFWVYMASDTPLAGNVAGIWWKGDTVLEANKWVKISLTDFGTAKDGLSNLTLRVCEATYLEGHQPIKDKTFYITSVYGVPKSVDPLVNNKATNYSVVSGNDELTSILNNHFFPDAE